jgi:hypothetical protein
MRVQAMAKVLGFRAICEKSRNVTYALAAGTVVVGLS